MAAACAGSAMGMNSAARRNGRRTARRSSSIAFLPSSPLPRALRAGGAGSGPEVDSQLVSVNITSGARVQRTSGPGLKVAPHFLTADVVAYLRKFKDVGELIYVGAHTGITY